MAVLFEKTKLLTDKQFHYCPGCNHGIIHRLVAEVIDEMGLAEHSVGISPVGCAVFAYNYIDIDWIEAAHGRALGFVKRIGARVNNLYPNSMRILMQEKNDLAGSHVRPDKR